MLATLPAWYPAYTGLVCNSNFQIYEKK